LTTHRTIGSGKQLAQKGDIFPLRRPQPMEPALYIALTAVGTLAALSAIAEFWRLR
jgi:hypothetical protein